MIQLKLTQQRLADADDVPAVLAASWEAFELVAAIDSASAGGSPGMYPAFTLAGGSAVTGRNALAFAPSMPSVPPDTGQDTPEPAGMPSFGFSLPGSKLRHEWQIYGQRS